MEKGTIMNEQLKVLIENYNQTDWDALLKEDLGKYHLKELKPHLDVIKAFLDAVVQNKDILTEHLKKQASSILNEFRVTKDQIHNHTDTSQNRNIINQVIRIKNMILDQGGGLSWALQIQKKFGDDPQEDIQKYKQAKQEFDEELKNLKKMKSEQSEQAIRSEVSRYGDFFKKEAENNRKLSLKYGSGLLFCSVLAVFISWYFYFDLNITINNIPELILKGNLINKLFIFTIIFFIITTITKEYLALRHQYFVNRHRYNALSSHKEILNSIEKTASESDKEISNAILLELTKAMFNPQDTGFIKNQKEISSENKVIEISRSLFNTKE